jgi:O-antigen/teichoic acid export membrane protein
VRSAESAGSPSKAAGLARHAIWNYLAAISTLLSSFVVLALAFRELPVHAVGIYSVAVASMVVLGSLDTAVTFAVGRTVAQGDIGLATPEATRLELGRVHAVLVRLSVAALIVGGLVLGAYAVLDRAAVGDWSSYSMIAAIVVALGIRLRTALLPAIANGLRNFAASGRSSVASSVVAVAVVAGTLPAIGIAGLGLGQLAGIAVGRGLLHRALRGSGWLPRGGGSRSTRSEMLAVARTSGVIAALGIATQLLNWADLVLISAFGTAAMAGLYRAAALLPTQACTLIYQGYDVVYPLLARHWAVEQLGMMRLLSTVFGAVSGVIFAALAWTAPHWVVLITGSRHDTAVTVLRIFCAVWAMNIPAHGIVLMMFARNLQGRLIPLVLCEGVANLVLTVIFVSVWGAEGAAAATLITLGASNLVALPILLRRELPGALKLTLQNGIVPISLSAGVAASAFAVIGMVLRGWPGFAVDLLVTCLVAAVCGLLAGGSRGRHALAESFMRLSG